MSEPAYIHVNPFPNRAARRHVRPVRFRNGERVNYTVFVPTKYQRPERNTPYVKPTDD